MPIYDYECFKEDCGYQLYNIEQSLGEDPIEVCPECKNHTLYRVILSAPIGFTSREVTTIGQLAEKNSKKMGKELVQRKTEEDNKKRNKPDSSKRDLNNKINKMNDRQKERYIMDGKI